MKKYKALIGVIIFGIIFTIFIVTWIIISISSREYKKRYLFNMEDYKINISSTPIQNDNRETYYTTSFEFVTENTGKKEVRTYFVDFDGIYKDKLPKDVKEVKINKKTFKYTQEQSDYDADLYYQIPKTHEYILIGVSGGSVYVNGVQLKMLAPVDEELLNSKELADVLDFDIK
jgi:hypothetical protein